MVAAFIALSLLRDYTCDEDEDVLPTHADGQRKASTSRGPAPAQTNQQSLELASP